MKLICKLSKLFAFVACFALTTNSFARATESPVGTWEVAVSGGESGIGYLTFSENGDLEGYGISKTSYGFVEYEGTWEIINYKIQGTINGYLDGVLMYQGTFSGTAKENKSISLAALSGGEPYKLKGKPQVSLSSISGSYYGSLKQLGVTGYCEFSVTEAGSPGLFWVDGFVEVPEVTSYTFEGYIILDRKGNIIACINTDPDADPSSMWGKIKVGGTTKLKGYQQYTSSLALTFTAD